MERLSRRRGWGDRCHVVLWFVLSDKLMHCPNQEGKKSFVCQFTPNVRLGILPIVLLRNGLSENTRLPVNREIKQIAEINIQCCQPKALNLLQLRKVKVIQTRATRRRTRHIRAISVIVKPTTQVNSMLKKSGEYVSRNRRNAPRTISPVSSVTFSTWSSWARRRRGPGPGSSKSAPWGVSGSEGRGWLWGISASMSISDIILAELRPWRRGCEGCEMTGWCC